MIRILCLVLPDESAEQNVYKLQLSDCLVPPQWIHQTTHCLEACTQSNWCFVMLSLTTKNVLKTVFRNTVHNWEQTHTLGTPNIQYHEYKYTYYVVFVYLFMCFFAASVQFWCIPDLWHLEALYRLKSCFNLFRFINCNNKQLPPSMGAEKGICSLWRTVTQCHSMEEGCPLRTLSSTAHTSTGVGDVTGVHCKTKAVSMFLDKHTPGHTAGREKEYTHTCA